MRPGFVAVVVLWLIAPERQALAAAPGAEQALLPRAVGAARIVGAAPVIDGRLDEPEWALAEIATDFVQRRPKPGALATVRTEARILYDDQALYVGVRAFDPEPQTILAPWPRRDDETTSDWIFVELDSRHDRRSAFSFGVNPRGVQVDGTFFNDVDYDAAWDAVWQAAAHVDALGWSAEYRIPFSQLPYAAEAATGADGMVDALWGLNVYRATPRRGESSNWSPRLPSLAGIVSHFNDLRLRVPAHRRRIELSPYAAVRSTHVPGANPLAEGQELTGGGDVKAGLGSSFTLSAAIRPDFSQVEADPSEVNLTAFETFFAERRPLFVEGAGLLRFDSSLPLVTRETSFQSEQPFYSRRIGGAPHLALPDDARDGHAPEAAPLLGALKLTGRSASGWSLGALAATTGRAIGELEGADGEHETRVLEPLTHFAAARVSRDFGGGRSALGAIATAVVRPGMEPALAAVLPASAFSAGVDGRHRFGKDAYELTGFLLGSRVAGTDAAIAGLAPASTAASTISGFASQLRLARIGGEHWRWTLASHAISPRLALNDLGFQRNADWLVAYAAATYQHESPGRLFRRWSIGSNQIAWGWSFGGDRRAAVIDATATADLHNYWGGSLSIDHELEALAVEAPHGAPAMLMPPRDAVSLTVYSDTRRASQFTLDAKMFQDHGTASHGLSLAPAASLRVSDRLALSLGPAFERRVNAWQLVAPAAGPAEQAIVGRLDQTTVAVTGRADLALSSALTVQLYLQPFASRGRFDDYQTVVAPRAARVEERVVARAALPADVADPAFAVTDLRLNFVLRWEYRPGSHLFVVWTQNRHDRQPQPLLRFPNDAFDAFGVPATNVFFVKLSYWLAR